MAVHGGLACAAAGTAGLRIFDVAPSAAPRPLGGLDSVYARTVSLATLEPGLLVAAVTGPAGLSLIAIDAAGAASLLALYPSRHAEDAVLADGLVCLAEGVRGLSIIDVRRPRQPRRVSSSDLDYALSAAVGGATPLSSIAVV